MVENVYITFFFLENGSTSPALKETNTKLIMSLKKVGSFAKVISGRLNLDACICSHRST